MEKIVELKNVSKVYKIGDNEFKALDNIDLSLNKGEMIVILGPSGAGKYGYSNKWKCNYRWREYFVI